MWCDECVVVSTEPYAVWTLMVLSSRGPSKYTYVRVKCRRQTAGRNSSLHDMVCGISGIGLGWAGVSV
jgi:hypothetical protein